MPTQLHTEAEGSSFNSLAKSGLWIAIVIAASIACSLMFACATPFAALAALAAEKMPRGQALTLTGCAWLANQLVGYLILHYPQTWDSFAWGAAIGVACLLATLGAEESLRFSKTRLAGQTLAFISAFFLYEGALFASTAFLPSGPDAFSLRIVARIFEINVVAFLGLLILHRVASSIGMVSDEKLLAGHDLRAGQSL